MGNAWGSERYVRWRSCFQTHPCECSLPLPTSWLRLGCEDDGGGRGRSSSLWRSKDGRLTTVDRIKQGRRGLLICAPELVAKVASEGWDMMYGGIRSSWWRLGSPVGGEGQRAPSWILSISPCRARGDVAKPQRCQEEKASCGGNDLNSGSQGMEDGQPIFIKRGQTAESYRPKTCQRDRGRGEALR